MDPVRPLSNERRPSREKVSSAEAGAARSGEAESSVKSRILSSRHNDRRLFQRVLYTQSSPLWPCVAVQNAR